MKSITLFVLYNYTPFHRSSFIFENMIDGLLGCFWSNVSGWWKMHYIAFTFHSSPLCKIHFRVWYWPWQLQ